MNYKIIAVDFDGTLCTNEYPNIGSPNNQIITYLNEQKNDGAKIILWTCRNGKILEAAVNWCSKLGLALDAVNENLEETINSFNGDTRKVFADEYIDDRCNKTFNLPYVQEVEENTNQEWR